MHVVMSNRALLIIVLLVDNIFVSHAYIVKICVTAYKSSDRILVVSVSVFVCVRCLCMSVCFSVWVFFSSCWWTSSAFIVHSYSGVCQVLDSEDITHLAASSPHFSHHLHHQCKQCKRINASMQYNLCFLLHQCKHILCYSANNAKVPVQTYIACQLCVLVYVAKHIMQSLFSTPPVQTVQTLCATVPV